MSKIAKAAFLACLCAGCVNYSRPIAQEAPLTPAQRNFEAVWNASVAVLRDYRFTVAVQDRRDGMIATAPLVGKQWFEFWRKDAARLEDVLENSIQTIYKTATVTIRPDPNDPDKYVAAVRVELARSDKGGRVITDTSEAFSLFLPTGTLGAWLTGFGRTAEEEAEETVTGKAGRYRVNPATWRVPIGRDEALERRMAAEIAAAANKLGKK